MIKLILIQFFAVLMAQGFTPEPFSFVNLNNVDIYVIDMNWYTRPNPDGDKAGIDIMLGSTNADICPIGTWAVTLSFEVWPDIYVDEVLAEGDCGTSNDNFAAVGGRDVINPLSDDMENYIQHGWRYIFGYNFIGNYGDQFWNALEQEVDAIRDKMIEGLPEQPEPEVPFYWFIPYVRTSIA